MANAGGGMTQVLLRAAPDAELSAMDDETEGRRIEDLIDGY